MENKFTIIFLITLLFFLPLFAEGKSNGGISFIKEIKEKISKEKEKVEEKNNEKEQEKVKTEEKREFKSKEKVKEKKNEQEERVQETSRIKEVKDKITKEKEKIEAKAEEKKKEKEKVKVKEKDKDKQDYVYDRRRKQNKIHRDDYYSDIYWIYDNPSYDVIYDDYTYIDNSDLILSRPIYEHRKPRRIAFLYSSVEAAYLGKDIRDTYGATAKISANLYSLHFNCFYQSVFSSEESLTLYSINGGFYFATNYFILTPFVGALYIEPLEEARLSYGANLQIFLPDNYNLDLYTLNSSYGSLNFNNFSASLNREFFIFNVGLGFNYNNYAGVNFSGPLVKLSFWL